MNLRNSGERCSALCVTCKRPPKWRKKTQKVRSFKGLTPPKTNECPLKSEYFNRRYIFQPLILGDVLVFLGLTSLRLVMMTCSTTLINHPFTPSHMHLVDLVVSSSCCFHPKQMIQSDDCAYFPNGWGKTTNYQAVFSHRIHVWYISLHLVDVYGNGIFTYFYHKHQPNVGKYTIHWTIHGSSGFSSLSLSTFWRRRLVHNLRGHRGLVSACGWLQAPSCFWHESHQVRLTVQVNLHYICDIHSVCLSVFLSICLFV